MFERFIVATDLSPASYAVVNCLAELKTFGARHSLLLQCLSFEDAASAGLSYHTDPLEAMLDEQKTILEDQGFTAEFRMVVGAPKKEIVRIAADEGYSLIVVGAQGHSLVEEKLLGGVAYGVINRSVKPVLVVPVEKAPGEENTCKPVSRSRFGVHVLFPTDFSEIGDNAFAYVKQLVADGVGKITLVHVQDQTKLKHLEDRLEEFNERDRERLEEMKQALLEMGASQIDIEIRYGVPYQEIARLVQERDAQLVVMATRGRGFVGELVLGSVSHNVARRSVAPVLLIPLPVEGKQEGVVKSPKP
jgi:nucleotide-binding universal stress UspA family protein